MADVDAGTGAVDVNDVQPIIPPGAAAASTSPLPKSNKPGKKETGGLGGGSPGGVAGANATSPQADSNRDGGGMLSAMHVKNAAVVEEAPKYVLCATVVE